MSYADHQTRIMNAIVKSIDLYTAGHTIKLQAVDEGEWHPQTALSEEWGFLTIKLQSRFWSKRFRHRMTGKSALDILGQLDGRAPEIEDNASALFDFVNGCISNYRHSGITLSKA